MQLVDGGRGWGEEAKGACACVCTRVRVQMPNAACRCTDSYCMGAAAHERMPDREEGGGESKGEEGSEGAGPSSPT